MAAKKSSKRKTVSVDFAGVESGGRSVPDGRWRGFPQSVEKSESEAGNEMLVFKWKVLNGPGKGAVVYDNVVLVPQALWKFKTLLEVLGFEVPDGEMDIDPDDLTGEDHEVVLEIANEEYKGKDRPRIQGFLSTEGYDEPGEEEEEKVGKPAAKKSSKKVEEEKEDDDDAGEEEEKTVKKGATKTPKIKEGTKVTFENDKGKTTKGTVVEVDGETVKVEDSKGDNWELDIADVELV